MMKAAMDRGQWVFFQNCHLAPSFMPSLERLVEQIDPDRVSTTTTTTTTTTTAAWVLWVYGLTCHTNYYY